ncbi:MAG TPA: hypothetical protein VGJ15_12985 [Pirellulales bacterium]
MARALLLAVEESDAVLRKLDPQRRAGVILALAGLVVLGVGMITLVWLGAQHVRRVARQRPIARPPNESSWNDRPLNRDQTIPRYDSDGE